MKTKFIGMVTALLSAGLIASAATDQGLTTESRASMTKMQLAILRSVSEETGLYLTPGIRKQLADDLGKPMVEGGNPFVADAVATGTAWELHTTDAEIQAIDRFILKTGPSSKLVTAVLTFAPPDNRLLRFELRIEPVVETDTLRGSRVELPAN